MEKKEEIKSCNNFTYDVGEIIAIGQNAGLNGTTLDLFCKYVIIRGFIRKDYYIEEWAERFKNGSYYNSSDEKGRTIINNLLA